MKKVSEKRIRLLENKRIEINSHKLYSRKDKGVRNFSKKQIDDLVDMLEGTQEEIPLITAKQSIDALTTTMKNLGIYNIYEKKRTKIKKQYSSHVKERVYRKNFILANDLIVRHSQYSGIFKPHYK